MKKTMLALALLSVATAAHAENGVPPMAGKPEDVGLSSAQLKRLEEVTQKHVDSGLVPGATSFDMPGAVHGLRRVRIVPTTRARSNSKGTG